SGWRSRSPSWGTASCWGPAPRGGPRTSPRGWDRRASDPVTTVPPSPLPRSCYRPCFCGTGCWRRSGPSPRSSRASCTSNISNPFNADYTDFILPWDTSSAEEIQRAFPRARVVGAFKNVWWEVFDAPQFGGLVSDVFVVGDDDQAKRRFLALAEGMPFRFLDAGRLRNARTVERMTLLSGEIGQRLGHFPPMDYRLPGAPWSVPRGGPL